MYSLSTLNRVQALYMLSMETCMLVMVPKHIACIPSHHVCAPLSLANRMWYHAKTIIACIVTHAPYIYSIEPCMHSMVQYKNNTFALLSLKHAWMPLHLTCMLLHHAHAPLSHACVPWHQAHSLLNVSLVALINWDHKSNIYFFLASLARVWTIKSIDCLVDKSILSIINAF